VVTLYRQLYSDGLKVQSTIWSKPCEAQRADPESALTSRRGDGAHEDDAERAWRAGMELVAAIHNLRTRAPLKICVGIATGD
jgi:hypothetical protein